jgi:hypothetical protein
MPMFAVPLVRSEEWNEFRCRALERLSVVEPKLGAVRHSLRYFSGHRLSDGLHLRPLRHFYKPAEAVC